MSKQEKILLFVVLTLAFALRFFQFTEIPFTNDELSTLNRLQFSSFSDMIQGAVYPDGHPAGVQTFLWFYTRILGTNQWVVKLPFVLMGFFSLPLYFFAAKNLSNTKIAFFTITFLATLQFPIFYAQTIRPYSSGQFLSALTIFFWSKHATTSKSFHSIWTIIFVGISIFLSLSNHYFSAFLAFYLLPIGLLLNRKNFNVRYFIPWILGIIFYIPQLGIFFHQLKIGSPGWLAVPTPNSLIHHLQYCFHFSPLYLLLFAVLIIAKMILAKGQFSFSKSSLIWLFCYLIPITTAYFYSIYRAPIFQDSIFIFSFFFLFLFLGDIFTAESFKTSTLILILTGIIVLNLSTLISLRQHYKQFYNHGYSKLVRDVNRYHRSYTPIHVFGFEPFFFHYYKNHYALNINNIQFHRDAFFADSAKNKQTFFRNFHNFKDSQIIFANAFEIPDWIIGCLEEIYPFSIRSLNFGSEVYLFSKTPLHQYGVFEQNKEKTQKSLHLIDCEPNVPQKLKETQLHYNRKLTFPYSSSEKYLETTLFTMQDLIRSYGETGILHATLEISAEIEFPKDTKDSISHPEKVKLICQITNQKGETTYFVYEHFSKILEHTTKFESNIYLNFNHFDWPKGGKISCFIENEALQKITLKQPILVNIKQGNQYIYSLTNDF